jgi:hypothetical protein
VRVLVRAAAPALGRCAHLKQIIYIRSFHFRSNGGVRKERKRKEKKLEHQFNCVYLNVNLFNIKKKHNNNNKIIENELIENELK